MSEQYKVIIDYNFDDKNWYKLEVSYVVHRWILEYDLKNELHHWPGTYSGSSYVNVREELLILIKLRFPA